MVNDIGGLPLLQCHVECLEHQLDPERGFHPPAYDPAAECIEYYGEIEKAGPSWNVSNVRHPQFIRSSGREVALHQIGCRPRPGITHGGGEPLAPAHTMNLSSCHQPRDSFAPNVDALRGKLGMNARRTVSPVRTTMYFRDPQGQLRIHS